jgi:hypothetical protein
VLRKNQRGDESEFTTKIRGKTNLGPKIYFYFVKFHSQLRILCLIMPKLAVSPPNRLTLRNTLIGCETFVLNLGTIDFKLQFLYL